MRAIKAKTDDGIPLLSKIDKGLWMGGVEDGAKLPREITAVVSLTPWWKYELARHQRRLEYEMYDTKDAQAEKAHTIAALVNALRRRGETVLVHCQMGLNRSGLITALALVKGGMKPEAAIAQLRERRHDMVLCNKTFEQYLLSMGEDVVLHEKTNGAKRDKQHYGSKMPETHSPSQFIAEMLS